MAGGGAGRLTGALARRDGPLPSWPGPHATRRAGRRYRLPYWAASIRRVLPRAGAKQEPPNHGRGAAARSDPEPPATPASTPIRLKPANRRACRPPREPPAPREEFCVACRARAIARRAYRAAIGLDGSLVGAPWLLSLEARGWRGAFQAGVEVVFRAAQCRPFDGRRTDDVAPNRRGARHVAE